MCACPRVIGRSWSGCAGTWRGRRSRASGPSLLADGRVRYRFKRAWRDGSVAVEFDPVDFVGKLAALVPRPRSNLVRYHGCLAPYASIRAYVVKDGRGQPPSKAELAAIAAARCSSSVESRAPISCAPQRRRGLRWPEVMQRVFATGRVAVPELRRSDEGDRGDHRQACGEDDARACWLSERCAQAVAGPRATGVGRVVRMVSTKSGRRTTRSNQQWMSSRAWGSTSSATGAAVSRLARTLARHVC